MKTIIWKPTFDNVNSRVEHNGDIDLYMYYESIDDK